jgi:hypothetical protein
MDPGGVDDRRDDAGLPRPGAPFGLGRELVSFALVAVWVVYLQGAVLVLLMGLAGRFGEVERVLLVMGFVGAAPLVGAALRAHVERHGGVRSGGVWDLGRRRTPLPAEELAARRARVTNVAVAVGSVAAFLAFYTGSLVAAAAVPLTLWWLLWERLRWREQR